MLISFDRCKWFEDNLEKASYKKIIDKIFRIFYEEIQYIEDKSDLNILNTFKNKGLSNNIQNLTYTTSGKYAKFFESLSNDINIIEIDIGSSQRFMYFVNRNIFYIRAILNKHT